MNSQRQEGIGAEGSASDSAAEKSNIGEATSRELERRAANLEQENRALRQQVSLLERGGGGKKGRGGRANELLEAQLAQLTEENGQLKDDFAALRSDSAREVRRLKGEARAAAAVAAAGCAIGWATDAELVPSKVADH